MGSRELNSLRARAEAAWTLFHSSQAPAVPEGSTADLFDSWSRSRGYLPDFRASAPLALDGAALDNLWQDSALQRAATVALDALRRDAESTGMVAALSDDQGRLMWTGASRQMRTRVEQVNFTVGSCWSETAIGTNAVAIAVQEGRAVTIFSAEHYAPVIHDWVCYAAPIRHPATGRVVGALDLSTTWDRHNPLALRAIQSYAQEIAQALPQLALAQCQLTLLGNRPSLQGISGERGLTRRQAELLCVLALRPAGFDLEGLHAAIYGDDRIALATLKSELSQLRRACPELPLASRPYRFSAVIQSDVLDLLEAIRRRDWASVLKRYNGPLLPRSESPVIVEASLYIEAAVQTACRALTDTAALLDFLERCPGYPEAATRLLELLAPGDPRRALAESRLKAAARD